jgi:hypothetical protein
VLEVTCAGSEVVRRFDFGNVGSITYPLKESINELDGDNLIFTLKVIAKNNDDGTPGLLLGVSATTHIKGGDNESKQNKGILPVESKADLGSVPWKLDFRNDTVYLLLNKDIPQLANKFIHDFTFAALVYPAIIRDILRRVIDEIAPNDSENEEDEEYEEDNKEWIRNWKRFAKLYNDDDLPSRDEEDDVEQWIDNVVSNFCEQFKLKESLISVFLEKRD